MVTSFTRTHVEVFVSTSGRLSRTAEHVTFTTRELDSSFSSSVDHGADVGRCCFQEALLNAACLEALSFFSFHLSIDMRFMLCSSSQCSVVVYL